MKESFISIIMPVYNAEKYLERSVGSVLKQTCSKWDLICVDDGSTDGSLDLLRSFAQKNGNIKVFSVPNGGPSAARNYGLKRAEGDYVLFLDSDDFLKKNAIKKLLEINEEQDYDITVFSAKISSLKEQADWVWDASTVSNGEFFGDECVKCLFYENGSTPFVWNKLFKKSVIDEISFDERLFLGEDQEFVFKAFQSAEKIRFADEPLYHYTFQRKASITDSSDGDFTFKSHLLLIESVLEGLKEFGNLEAFSQEAINWAHELIGGKENGEFYGILNSYGLNGAPTEITKNRISALSRCARLIVRRGLGPLIRKLTNKLSGE